MLKLIVNGLSVCSGRRACKKWRTEAAEVRLVSVAVERGSLVLDRDVAASGALVRAAYVVADRL